MHGQKFGTTIGADRKLTYFIIFHSVMALMHDYVRRANFTTKPRLRGIFSAFALFVHGYSFKFTALGHSFMQNFATLQFKTRLGGEICSLDVNMHKGYWLAAFSFVGLHATVSLTKTFGC